MKHGTATYKIYHILPHEGGWQARLAGARRASGVFQTREEAVARATALARKHAPALVRVLDAEGSVEAEYAFDENGQ